MGGIKSKRSKKMFVLVSHVLSWILVRFIMSLVLLLLLLLLFGHGTNEDILLLFLINFMGKINPRNQSKGLLFSLA